LTPHIVPIFEPTHSGADRSKSAKYSFLTPTPDLPYRMDFSFINGLKIKIKTNFTNIFCKFFTNFLKKNYILASNVTTAPSRCVKKYVKTKTVMKMGYLAVLKSLYLYFAKKWATLEPDLGDF
jgi:hypothetical protein